MKYEDVDCGMRVVAPQGRGVVESYDAHVPHFRELFSALGGETPPKNRLKAHVKLDSGGTAKVLITKLKREVA
jgi:hypothetical protein